MLTTSRPYPDSVHPQSKNPLNPTFVNQTNLFNKQRHKRSGSSSAEEQLNKNMNLFNILLKKNTEEDKIKHIRESLKQGADINFQDANRGDNTLLHIAVKKRYSKVVEYLLKESNIKINLKNKNKDTPEDLAKDKPEIINIFDKFSSTSENHLPLIVQESLIPNGFKKGTAIGGGDCFFDSLAQGMNKLSIPGGPFNVQSLRNDCAEYARDHADSIVPQTHDKTWRKMITDDANAGGYATGSNGEQDNFNGYLVGIQLTAESGIVGRQPVWGRPEIEGRMLCQKYGIKLHLIEKLTENNEEVIGHQLIDATGSKSIDVKDNLYRDSEIVHLLNEGRAHFEPILPVRQASPPPVYPERQYEINNDENSFPAKVQLTNPDNSVLNAESNNMQSILPPFSGSLGVDTKLKLKNDIQKTITSLVKNKELSEIEKLKNIPNYPKPYLLAKFASLAYTDYKENEAVGDYEKRLALPEGWKLLTTATNTETLNGYFANAFWHPEYQQVVIAHRGTNPTTLGADWADVKGVVFNNYVPQMNSAVTFADKVVTELSHLSKVKNIEFQLFFTGHSLGGWLAQITTFTTEYLHLEGVYFQKNVAPGQYHAHTVVFDSPGCAAMLSQMSDKFDVRYSGHFIKLVTLYITSYLSAPNRINTCNTHVGTIYRLFTDLSDLSWKERNTPLYNLKAHSMDRILQAFDSETGQVRRDKVGHIRLQEVIDWPISGLIRRGEEYKSFFQWANHLNDYHPDPTDESFQGQTELGYYKIRYQTKPVDEKSCHLSVFTPAERQFLERYQWLRGLPEFFRPQALFAQSDKTILNRLQTFEISGESIRCSEAETLQKIIPYVKHLLKWFPEISSKAEKQLSAEGVIQQVYQIETENYLKKMQQSSLEFKSQSSELERFLGNSQQKIWHQEVDGEPRVGLAATYQSFEKLPDPNFSDKSRHTLLKLGRLLTVQQLADVHKLFTDTGHLLMIECKSLKAFSEAQSLLELLVKAMRSNDKLILVSRRDQRWIREAISAAQLPVNSYHRTTQQPFTWGDLTTDSQRALLGKITVDFQGSLVKLQQLAGSGFTVTDTQPLSNLLDPENSLAVGQPVAISKGYDEDFYIERTFNHQITVKEEIFDKASPDLIAKSQQEFAQLCQQNPNKNIHWLQQTADGLIIWQQSQGSLEALRQYIDTQAIQAYPPEKLNDFLQQARQHKVMLIADTPGMGKSTVLTHLSQQIKAANPAQWVVRLDLNDYTAELQKQTRFADSDQAIEFLANKLLKLNTPIEQALFKESFQNTGRVALLFDGFDEISPNYKEKVLDLLGTLKRTTVDTLWVTTRPHTKGALENRLQQFSYTLEPLSEDNQISFLSKYWQRNLDLTDGLQQNQDKLKVYAEALVTLLNKSIDDEEKEFTGIPLQIRLLAEIYQDKVNQFYHSDNLAPELPEKLSLTDLYDTFTENKFNIYKKEKLKALDGNIGIDKLIKDDIDKLKGIHQQLSIQLLLIPEKVNILYPQTEPVDKEKLAQVGIVQISDGNTHFIHRTFAEYFAADFLTQQLTGRHPQNRQVQDFLLQDIFMKSKYQVIRTFLNGQLAKKPAPESILPAYGERIAQLWPGGSLRHQDRLRSTILQISYDEYNTKINIFLLNSLKKQKETLKELLLATDTNGGTALHWATKRGNAEVVRELLTTVKATVGDKALKELLLATDTNGETALHWATKRGNAEVVRELLTTVKATVGDKALKPLLLATDTTGGTALHWVAGMGNAEVVRELLTTVQKTFGNETLKELLFATNKNGEIALHGATERDNAEVVRELLTTVQKTFGNETLKEQLLATSENGGTALHWAAGSDNAKVVRELLTTVQKTFGNETLKELLLATSEDGGTALHWAAGRDNAEVVRELLTAVQKTFGNEVLKQLLLASDNDGHTALHWATKDNYWAIATALLNHGADINDLDAEQCDSLKEYLAQGNDEHQAPLLAKIKHRLLDLSVEYMMEVAEQAERVLEAMDAEPGPSRCRRDLQGCGGEEREGRVFPYEPLEESVSVEQQRAARLQSQLALALVWGQREPADKLLQYQRYLGDILEEGAVNQSPREQELLRDHYQQAQQFFADNPKTTLLEVMADNFEPLAGHSVLLENGQQSLLVFNEGERYQLYSPDFNYRQRFQTRVGVSWSELSGFIRAFFVWKSGSGEYRPLVLTDPLLGKALAPLEAAPYWQPDTLAPDSVLLAREQAGLIEGIPAWVVRELVRVNGQVIDAAALHADFFQTPGIQLRVEKLHSVLTELTEAQRRAVVQGVNKYHWSADSTLLETLSTEERPLLAEYQQQVMHELKTADTLTPERLSEFSWQALNQAFDKHPDISPELKQQALTSVQELHAKATQHAWAKGIATQTLFFLPDMIRAANTGQVGGLVGTAGMLAADGGVNHLYGRLLERLAPTLSESRLGLLRKLPLTSPVFKALTVYSIVELTQQLHSLPPDSPQRQIIKHRLGEQYVTAGLMVAELFGFELGPLWVGLIAEQVIFEAITFRKEHQLDIPFWEAFIMSLGFEQDKLQHIVEERQLVELNLATVDNINAQANPPYGWVLVKMPSLGPLTWQPLDEQEVPHNISAAINRQKAPFSFSPGTEIVGSNGFRRVSKFTTHVYPAYNAAVTTRGKLIGTQWERGIYYATIASTVIQFAPIGHSCQEDNIFLEHPQGGANYRRIASVTGKNYPFCLPSTPVKISGPGLAALYANNHTAGGAPRNLYVNFDPCEGDLTLVFTPPGLEALDKMNQIFNPHYLNNASSRYQVTVQVGHKNYPDSIIFPQDGGLLMLRDGTQRVNSQYFITTNSRPFRIRDEATVTRVAFTATKAAGYVMGSDGPEIIQLQPPIDNATDSTVTPFFSTVWLKGPKKYLQLQLAGQQIAGVLRLSAEQVEVLSAQGQDAYHSAIVMSNHVVSFAVTIVGHLRVTQGDITLYCVGDTPQNTAAIRYAKTLSTPHILLYQLELAALQPVLDTLSRSNAMEQRFSTPGFNYTWLPGVERAIVLKIIGPLKGQPAQLLLEQDRSTLSQLDEQQQLRIMAVDHYSQQATLDNQLVLQQVITGGNTTNLGVYQPAGASAQDFQVVDSVYPHGPGDILWFQSPQGYLVLHRFASGQKMTLNGIDYQIADNRLYAIGAQTGIIDGDQLIRYRTPTRRVRIRVASSLAESQLSWDKGKLTINQLTLRNLPEQTPIDLGGQAFPLKALKESVHRHRHHHRRDLPRVEPLTSGAARHQPWASTLFREAVALLSGISWEWPTWGGSGTAQPAQPPQNSKIMVDEYTSGHFQGLLQLLDLGVRQWTGQKYGQQPVIANGSWAEACVQAEQVIEEFHQTLQGAARACGVKFTTVTQRLDEMTLRNQVAQKLYTGQPQAIEKLLQPVVQSLYQTLCSRATPKQADRFMAHCNRHNNQSVDINHLQQQWVSLPSTNNMTCPINRVDPLSIPQLPTRPLSRDHLT